MKDTRLPRLLVTVFCMGLGLLGRAEEPLPNALPIGDRAMARSDYEAAITAYTQAIESGMSRSAAYDGRGRAKRSAGDLEGAIADFNQAIEFAPEWGAAYSHRGGTRILRGDLKGGEADYRRAAELTPDMAGVFCMSRGWAKECIGDLRGAIADFNQGIELKPNASSFYGTRGHYWLVFGHWHNALADYRKHCELSTIPRDSAHLFIWVSRMHLGETEAANQELQDYLQKAKPSSWTRQIGQYLLGQIPEDRLFLAAHDVDPVQELNRHCEAFYYAGVKRLFAGDKEGAAACFRNSLATERNHFDEYELAEAELKAHGW